MTSVQLTQTFHFDPNKVREWQVASGTLEGTAVLSASNQPGVTITPRGDSTKTKTLGTGGIISLTFPNGAVGQRTDSASVATDGTWSGPVTGVTSGTARNTLVYAVGTGGATGAVASLTLTSGGNTLFGVTDDYPGKASASLCAVKIGKFA